MARKILPLIEAGYRIQAPFDPENFTLLPPQSALPGLHFRTVRDELTRGILFEKSEADVLFNSLSLSKTRWFEKRGARVIETPGHHLSFIGFNLKDPVLADPVIRRAIFHALPVEHWARHKYFDLVTPLRSIADAFQPTLSRSLLRSKPPLRFRFLTTPVREGYEQALLVRAALAGVGVGVEIVPLESSLFFQRLKRGDFQLFGSRLLRETAEDSIADYVLPDRNKNYFSWRPAPFHSEKDGGVPWSTAEQRVLEELPFIPLFTWKHGLLLSSRVRYDGAGPSIEEDSFRFLATLRID
jgi:ABC-type transport system substrate-binding protein